MKPLHLLKSAIIGSIIFSTACAHAQMVGTDIFLKGQYMEVGIGHLGYYGSDAGAPTGYHPHLGGGATNLGFVADPAMDGWTVGTPAYMGDYFYPGSPFEGWELQVNGARVQAYDGGPSSSFAYSGGMPACTGANLSYGATGSTVSAIWQGMMDSIQLTQVTSFDTSSLFFNVKITLTNIAVLPQNNIYYFRSLDPDNDESWPGGSFSTNNVIEHQVKDTTVVSALGHTGPLSYMALGTTDTSAVAVIYNAWGLSVAQDLAAVYNKTYSAYYTQKVNNPGDIALGLVISIPHLATVDSASDSTARTTATSTKHPANTATFSYFYAFSQDAVDSAIVASHASPIPVTPPSVLNVTNTNAASNIKMYPNPTKTVMNITGLDITDHISVYDMMGKTITNDWAVGHQGTNTFPMSNMAAGAYIIVVTDANGTMKARVPVRKL